VTIVAKVLPVFDAALPVRVSPATGANYFQASFGVALEFVGSSHVTQAEASTKHGDLAVCRYSRSCSPAKRISLNMRRKPPFGVADDVCVMDKGRFMHRASVPAFRRDHDTARRLLGIS
jgi:hypothetical protein